MVNDRYNFLDEGLEERRSNHQFRSLSAVDPVEGKMRVQSEGSIYIDFSSNDYLGLATHPNVKERAVAYTQKYGAGSTASRLISGTRTIHTQLEKNLAEALGREAALLFNTGFQANSSLLGSLTDRHSLILADKLSHNSLLQGSLSSRAEFQRFRHNNMDHLEQLLQKASASNYSRIWIVTETIFSMDGNRSPLDKILSLANEFGALLFVDDAHAVGVWGPNGMGLASNNETVDILLGTCGKAFGSFGAYVGCSKKMKDYLVNFCPGFIYTTAPPPSVVGATQAALELIPTLDEERQAFHKRIENFRDRVQQLGFKTAGSSQIVPIIIGDEKKTLDLASWLQDSGLLATAIRPPTVPAKSSRIRITLSMKHTPQQIEKLLNALAEWKNEQS